MMATQSVATESNKKGSKWRNVFFDGLEKRKILHIKMEFIESRIVFLFEDIGVPRDVSEKLLMGRMERRLLEKTFRKHNVEKRDRFRAHARFRWYALKGGKTMAQIRNNDEKVDYALKQIKKLKE